MRHRRVELQRLQSRQRHLLPVSVAFLPVKRRIPILLPHPLPAVRQPVRGRLVAAGGHELEPFAICHQAVGQTKRIQQDFMSGHFVVEREAAIGVTDLHDAAVKS